MKAPIQNSPESPCRALAIIDELITQLPSRADALLDLRLALSQRSQPGTCVRLYFDLLETVSGWHAARLEALRSELEQRIRIEIVIAETQSRMHTCLNLKGARRLEDFCQDTMLDYSRKNRKAKRIEMSFAWTA